METLVIRMAIGFALRQLAQFGEKTDWQKVKADCETRIHPLLHAEFLNLPVDHLIDHAVDAVAAACMDRTDLQAVADKAMAGDWKGCLLAIKATLQTIAHKTFVEQKLLAAVSGG